MLTGDSLFVGDAARPDLAVGAARGRRGALPLAPPPARALGRRRGVPRPRRRLALRQVDELEAVDHDRLRAAFNPTLQITRRRRVHRRVRRRSAHRSRPTSARIVEANRGPFVGALAARRRSSPHRRERRAAARRAAGAGPPRRAPAGRDQRAGLGLELRDQGGIRARRRRSPSACSPRPSTRRATRSAGSSRSRSSTSPGTCSAAATSARTASRSTSSRSSSRDGVEVIDVREKDERDTGLHPRQPQRPVPAGRNVRCPTFPPIGRSSRSARAAPAPRSPPASSAPAATTPAPSSTAAWPSGASVAATVEFRRCGTA